MKLTGKCKKDFEKWYNEVQKYNIGWFYRLQPEYQYGVYVDYFDSVGFIMEIQPICEVKMSGLKTMGYRFYVNGEVKGNVILNTRPEARTAAIEKANEIYKPNTTAVG